jgi:glycosyltransferase involved in cell wall biosynthesis
MDKRKYFLSVVIPVYNEEENIDFLYKRLHNVLKQFKYEIIMVNDGSTDNTVYKIKRLIKNDSRVKLLNFSRNFGHEAATTAGVEYSNGEAVVVIDADLQDPPELIPAMINLWRQGYEVVYAQRKTRGGETLFKKATSSLFYKFMNIISDIPIPLNAGDYRLMDCRVVADFKNLTERNRFFRGLITWLGYKQIGIQFRRESRHAGITKYSYLKLIKLSLDSITSFSIKPLSLITYIGFFLSILCVLAGIVFIFVKIYMKFPVPGWTSIIVVILFMGSFQIFIIGIIGEYVGRMFIEVKSRPLYITKEVIDADTNKKNKVKRS